MRQVLWVALLSVDLAAQTPNQGDVTLLIRELRTAIQDGSLATAAELANGLDDAVQQRHSAWLVRDAGQRTEEVIAWLPEDMESLWVNQEPFTINPEESVQDLYGRPTLEYSMDRLIALNGGEFYRALWQAHGPAGGGRGKKHPIRQLGIPGPMTAQDVVYFYFFAEPIDLPPPDESVQERPVWHATAKIDSGDLPRPGAKRTQRDDESWISLARPDLLILTNPHELLAGILGQLARATRARAIPTDLPEWATVDRSASFWGVRHYTAQSKPTPEDPDIETAELPMPDSSAVGVTVQFDSVHQQLEIRYLSKTQLAQGRGYADSLRREFHVDHPRDGVWRLRSDIQARGPWPVHFALTMLGFGMYQ